MTQAQIKATYADLDDIHLRFSDLYFQVQGIIFDIRASQQALRPEWKGFGADSFFDEMDTLLPALGQLQAAIYETALFIKEARRKIEETEYLAATTWWERHSDKIHGWLDGIGLVPLLGEPADGLNALIYALEGEYFDATLSGFGLITLWGDTLKLLRYAPKPVRDAAESLLTWARNNRDRMPDILGGLKWLTTNYETPYGKAFLELINQKVADPYRFSKAADISKWLTSEPEKFLELAKEPNGVVDANTLWEASIGLSMVENGTLRGPIKRASGMGGDILDRNRTEWDIKSL